MADKLWEGEPGGGGVDMNMKEEDGILELGSGSSVSGEGSCRYIPG